MGCIRTQAPVRIIVIGGGISGLSAAHRLLELARGRRRPIELTLLEADPRLGGAIQTVHRDGFIIESGPDNFVTDKPAGLNLCRRLGLGGELLSTNKAHRRALVVRNNRLLPVPEGFLLMAPTKIGPILTTPIFSWRGKLNILAERFRPAESPRDDESLSSFVTRRFGREALDRLVQPLIGGIYAADPETLSLRATMPRFLDFEAAYGSVTKGMRAKEKRSTASRSEKGSADAAAPYSMFVTLQTGMQTLVDSLAEKIGATHIRVDVPVERIMPGRAAPWKVQMKAGESYSADVVLIACPTYRAASLLADLDAELAAGLSELRYASSAVVHLAFSREQIVHPLDAFGIIVPHIENCSIFAVSFNSTKYRGRAPDGQVLMRVFLGGVLQHDVIQRDDDDLTRLALSDLQPLLGITGRPLWTTVDRYDRSMPQYQTGHQHRVSAIMDRVARCRGLAVIGNAFTGVGIPDCIRQAEEAAETIFEDVVLHVESNMTSTRQK